MKKLFIIFLFLILPAVSFSASCDGTALSGLTEDTAPTADDLFYSVNDPSGTPGDRKVTFDSILRPTIQATDPTSSDDSGLYVNSVDGDAFLVSKNIGISTWATTYTPAATSSYLINQNFETDTTGYDNGETWAEFKTDGTVTIDPAYTTTVLAGTQSCYLASPGYQTASITSPSFTSTDTISHKFIYYAESLPTSTVTFLEFRSSSTDLCNIYQKTDGALSLEHGTVIVATAAGEISTGIKYYCWVDITNSSGADDGTMSVYISETDSKPGTATITTSVGTNTTDFTNIKFIARSGWSLIVDRIVLE